jgi:hypothetical protein
MTHGLRAGTAAPDRAISPGEIQANPSASGLFPGASFFDVFLEIDLPLLGTLHNPEPLMIENSDITCFPPEVFFLARRTGPVSMVFKADDTEMPPRWLAGQRFGWMVLAGLASNFDTTGAALSWAWNGEGGPARLGDPFAEFEQILEAEPEMADSATAVVDVIDVVTYSDPTAFVEPDLRDSVLAGIDRAAELGQSGNPCAGTEIIVQLYLRTDGVPDPDDWVTDPTVRAVLAERIHELGAILQRQADEVGGCGVLAAPEPELAGALAIVAIRPNPSFGAVHLDCAIPVDGQVSVAIYDLAGRLVSRLVDGHMPAGRHRVTWSGDPGLGNRSSSGIYFALLKSGGHSAVRRLIVVR